MLLLIVKLTKTTKRKERHRPNAVYKHDSHDSTLIHDVIKLRLYCFEYCCNILSEPLLHFRLFTCLVIIVGESCTLFETKKIMILNLSTIVQLWNVLLQIQSELDIIIFLCFIIIHVWVCLKCVNMKELLK